MVLPNLLKGKEQLALEEYISMILKNLRHRIVYVRLFGSSARGGIHPESDIDVLLVLKDRLSPTGKTSDFIDDLGLKILIKYEVLISPVIFSRKEYNSLNKRQTNFMYWVNKEGVDIWPVKKKKI